MEPLSTILFFSVNDRLPVLPKFSQNGQLGLGTRYGAEIRIIWKLGTSIFRCATEGTSINDFSISVKDHFPHHQTFPPKWITRSKNTLRRIEKFHIEANNLYFHVRYLGKLYERFYLFFANDPLPDLPHFPEMENSG